ncbi:hypothetical protein RJ639_027891 [Escallonia herrerae]|uniref:Cytochrome P450 n=1 Tax=Escallonia herrerae TaxID=1293975 RepID=A0AA88X6L1_9ASTE|nr:hypothetical protein RJ639_027891 [Escallonia herrerae]
MWAIGRDPTIWDKHTSFKPERFLNSMVDLKGHDFEFIPFGSGRRMCPGQPLASRVVPLLVASLIQRFDWYLPNDMDPSQIDMSEMYDIKMQKKEPLSVTPKRRISDSTVKDWSGAIGDAEVRMRSELEALEERLQLTVASQVEQIFNRLDDLEVDSRLAMLERKFDVFTKELDDLIEERVTYFTKREVQRYKDLKGKSRSSKKN